ncbi:MAG TPA: FHA domain-containing protein [Acidimicrobiales bacterium]|nr:FHA domain-containing protein [Acidimicrobiales bacterium]
MQAPRDRVGLGGPGRGRLKANLTIAMPFLQQDDPSSTRHSVIGERMTIGRGTDNGIVLVGDMRVSRRHAEVHERDREWFIQDLNSRNGCYLNGEKVTEARLRDGDRIKIGGSNFVFSAERDPMATIADTGSDVPLKTTLSDREKEVLQLLYRGSTDQQIAGALFISLSTVRSHLDRIRDKTGCRRRPELTRLAIELGLGR